MLTAFKIVEAVTPPPPPRSGHLEVHEFVKAYDYRVGGARQVKLSLSRTKEVALPSPRPPSMHRPPGLPQHKQLAEKAVFIEIFED